MLQRAAALLNHIDNKSAFITKAYHISTYRPRKPSGHCTAHITFCILRTFISIAVWHLSPNDPLTLLLHANRLLETGASAPLVAAHEETSLCNRPAPQRNGISLNLSIACGIPPIISIFVVLWLGDSSPPPCLAFQSITVTCWRQSSSPDCLCWSDHQPIQLHFQIEDRLQC